MTVTDWLDSSERDYETGRQLYAALGANDRLQRLLSAGPNHYNRECLVWELTKLARAGGGAAPVGVTPIVQGGTPTVPTLTLTSDVRVNVSENATETLQKVESSTEKVESLPPKGGELLAELKVAQRGLYDERAGVHAQLEGAATEEDRRLMAERVMGLSRQLNTNWNTYHYVEAHGELPPAPAAAPGLDQLSPADLLKRRNNLRSQVSKLKKNPARADDLVRVETELAQVEKLLNPTDGQ